MLAVSGSIAAYKTPGLVRLLIKAGAEVKVIMTPAAADFVTPLALATVSKHPVLHSVSDGASWNNHVELGRWADVMLIAPCSANTLAKMAGGLCDNLLLAVYLSATCPVVIAPAMDEDMWMHPSTRRNLELLRNWGNAIIPVAHGELASGLVGEGRMAEPEVIAAYLGRFLAARGPQPLKGRKALVTAGPTYERLDPVRFIGNFSTGKMGIAIADALAGFGAEVKLILGPTELRPSHPDIETTRVESATRMWEVATEAWPDCDLGVMAAAVADYSPAEQAPQKIKKSGSEMNLPLVKTKDILATLGASKREGQLLVGFALETEQEHSNAQQKLHTKNADLIVLNSLRDAGAGFGHDTNKVTLLDRQGRVQTLPLQSKADTAAAIVNRIAEVMNHENEPV